MLRNHFIMSGDNKPDFIITYYAPERVPFFGGYAKKWVYGYSNYGSGVVIDENIIKFKVIGDKWNNGVGEWKFRLEDSSNKIYNSTILGKKIDNLDEINYVVLGFADLYDDITSEEKVDNTNIITSVIFGEGIETINGSILANIDRSQSSCTEITLPESVTLLTGDLFNNYTSLKTITVPLNVIRIDNLCNIGGNSLEEVILKPFNPPNASNTSEQTPLGIHSNNVKDSLKIRVYADAINNYKNDSIWGQYSELYDTINDSIVYYMDNGSRRLYTEKLDITSINPGIFPSGILLQSITNVYLPNSITNIEKWTFRFCYKLTSVEIPNSVTSIGTGAFFECGLTSITIPNSVTSIGNLAFSDCTSLTSIIVDKNNQVYDSRDNCNAIIHTATNTLIGGCKNTVIPDSVTSILEEAFYQYKSLTSITIPNSVTSIGRNAFYESGLKSVVIGNSVTSIGDYAFNSCTSLTSITISSIVPPLLGYHVFNNLNYTLQIYVPDESVDTYKTATNWSLYASKIKPISKKPV